MSNGHRAKAAATLWLLSGEPHNEQLRILAEMNEAIETDARNEERAACVKYAIKRSEMQLRYEAKRFAYDIALGISADGAVRDRKETKL